MISAFRLATEANKADLALQAASSVILTMDVNGQTSAWNMDL